MSVQYSISAICKVLNINRSKFYYQQHPRTPNRELEQVVIDSFRRSRNNYGTRRIQAEIPNILDRKFNRKQALDVIVSDLTYVKVNDSWCYICLIIDLWNREIVGWSVGKQKNAELVQKALYSIPYPLDHINVFHSDRGKEFDNQLIDEVVEAFRIQRSLSQKGCPYDNAVVESTNKSLKTEFIYQHNFTSLEELQILLFDYIHWYNNVRLHSSLGYQTPISKRHQANLSLFYNTPLFTCPKKG